MSNPKDIRPTNVDGLPHGEWIRYNPNGSVCDKGNYINNKEDGFWEAYWVDGTLAYMVNYINGVQEGYNEWSDINAINNFLTRKTFYLI